MRASEMDIVRKLFAIRFVSGGAPDGCFELYIEDDEWYSEPKFTVNNFWIDDLIAVAKAAKEKIEKGQV